MWWNVFPCLRSPTQATNQVIIKGTYGIISGHDSYNKNYSTSKKNKNRKTSNYITTKKKYVKHSSDYEASCKEYGDDDELSNESSHEEMFALKRNILYPNSNKCWMKHVKIIKLIQIILLKKMCGGKVKQQQHKFSR